ncbi:MAG: transcriptional repressor [FCB group bacterium]|nr:transcriptional repressor [FCB group bacterium]
MMRYSKQREEILKIIRNTNVHPTADWVYEQVRKTIPNISLGTVYRNLNQLVAAELILSIKDNTVVRYDGNVNPHNHFKCLRCGNVYDVEIPENDFIPQINRIGAHRVTNVRLELEGICADCVQKEKLN